ncbi:MAG: antibiotic biosynthesis monooxygenase [Gemmatimonadetes bacterium]|jgi:quinol monooxygenase YgiN|nr:antibiotic biosynthesis monooxygenase [Gemmatimonadota bacterium]MCC7322859.1 antibiotic biosynthesis monooxygenase [Gemmatimonadaceae bacterium]MBK6844075.1 antibiotic biosynthesis monooxygenase [Gemmatimonadota bacterium]MBK7834064.1 antibiotic biosynthesis monooxygenase [Gemmatimonadota bacterium]MBK8060279.1 antibiotic biosynthesis monooxygenase [Gemmatimonadota bacterium]
MITLVAQFTMKPGKVALALRRVDAVRAQADQEQPGTLLYLVHRVLDAKGRPTRTLLFYESYRDAAALQAHLDSASWKALEAGWSQCFEGTRAKGVKVTKLDRIGGFVHLQAP